MNKRAGLSQSNVTSHINAYLHAAGKESYFMEDNAENKSITQLKPPRRPVENRLINSHCTLYYTNTHNNQAHKPGTISLTYLFHQYACVTWRSKISQLYCPWKRPNVPRTFLSLRARHFAQGRHYYSYDTLYSSSDSYDERIFSLRQFNQLR